MQAPHTELFRLHECNFNINSSHSRLRKSGNVTQPPGPRKGRMFTSLSSKKYVLLFLTTVEPDPTSQHAEGGEQHAVETRCICR